MVTLTDEERAMLGGEHGESCALAMRIVTGLARVLGAQRLVPIAAAHIDGCLYHGTAGLDFALRLVELGGKVAVSTTLNVGSLDLLHPGLVRGDDELCTNGRRLMDAYTALGATPTWTCAPYHAGHRPAAGEHVAWAESNAIVFANSVLGARTGRYGDFLDICAAITGRAPYAGLHRDEDRRGKIVFDLTALPSCVLDDELLAPVLGHLVGKRAGTRVPVISGLPGSTDEDALKALGAAAASAGGVALFHAVGLTPEAPTLEAAMGGEPPAETVRVTPGMLDAAHEELSTAAGDRLDAVSLGTPHASRGEFGRLAGLLADGPPLAGSVAVYLSTSRAVLAEAERQGYAATCRAAGVRIVTDTCTYVTPILAPGTRVVMTNSAKWAYYAPANIGVDTILASLDDCVASAREGRAVRARRWSTHDGPTPHSGYSATLRDGDEETPARHGGAQATARHGLEQVTARQDDEQAPAARPDGALAAAAPDLEFGAVALHPGAAEGELAVLDSPVSFWGGTDRHTGRIVDEHHPQCGADLAGRVVVMRTGRGSSSSASVLAEAIRAGTAPAAVLLAESDAIVVIGALVAAELYERLLPVVVLDEPSYAALPRHGRATVEAGTERATVRVSGITPTTGRTP